MQNSSGFKDPSHHMKGLPGSTRWVSTPWKADLLQTLGCAAGILGWGLDNASVKYIFFLFSLPLKNCNENSGLLASLWDVIQ